MPVHLKLVISALALIVTAGVFWFDTRAGAGATRWVALALGPLMVFSIWIFPEANSKDIRRDAANRRADEGDADDAGKD